MSDQLTGTGYWRSLEQLADSPEMKEMISQEFPGYDADEIATTSRRSFLKLMAASLALAGLGLTGCRRVPKEKLMPYAAGPRDRIAGIPEQYATAWEISGVATGLLVTSYDGRPIKVEGNPSHPYAWTIADKIGAADSFAQASILELYDPQRSRNVVFRKGEDRQVQKWADFSASLADLLKGQKGKGDGLAVLSEPCSSPTVAALRKNFLAAYPNAKWYEYEPLSRDAEREGAKLAYGSYVRPVLHLDKATVIVSIDNDLLGVHPAHIRYAADWASGRDSADKGEMNRMYVAEAAFTITGSVADQRLPADPSRLYPILRAIATKVGVAGISGEEKLSELEAKFVNNVVADLTHAGSKAVVTVGPAVQPEAHAVAFAINEQLKAVGNTITLHEDPASDRPSHDAAITSLAADIKAGKVKGLFVIGGNPSYDAPADLKIDEAIKSVPWSARLSTYEDETSVACKWHLPRAHYLESWGDARAWDGTISIVQPLIEPLFGGKTTIELLAEINGDEIRGSEKLVQRTWSAVLPAETFERDWKRSLQLGIQPETALPAAKATLQGLTSLKAPEARPATGIFVRLQPDTRIYDGRFANNGWLQEIPDPFSKIVWDNAAYISKVDADASGITTNDLIRIEAGGQVIEAAAYVMPGQPVNVIGISLGYGRQGAGSIGNGLGFNAYKLKTTQAPYGTIGSFKKAGGSYDLATTQNHHIMDKVGEEGRDVRVGKKGESGPVVREGTLAQYKANPRFAQIGHTLSLQLFDPPHQFNDPHAWGMSIDMNTCIGCNACTVACQAENNIPVVGKTQVFRHRQMHWIRVDRYFKGAAEDPEIQVIHQPVTCQHCENAPCEQVCPVAATVHDTEGLNTMVYNRCIGTRYCSNNCPYKVRRFNYFDFNSVDPRGGQFVPPWPSIPDMQQNMQVDPIRKLANNPEVTVRMRGVMEKCTYCVQRIHTTTTAKRAKNEEVKDGDIITACQQACPTRAIRFGNLNEKEAVVTQKHQNKRAYKLLDDLNTRPRTVYLAKVRNPAGAEAAPAHGAPAEAHHG